MDDNELKRAAGQHMLLHFTDMPAFSARPLVLERGDGCYVFDTEGNRYIDGLSGLYCTQVGHSFGDEIGRAAWEQMRTLPFRASALGRAGAASCPARPAGPGARVLHVRRLGRRRGRVEDRAPVPRGQRPAPASKAIARKIAYHGTTMGALSFTGLGDCRAPFEPLAVPTSFVSATDSYRHPAGDDEPAFCRALLDEIESVIEFETPETIAMLIAEPVQNSGG